MELCKLCPWKLVRHHIYKMFCWFRSLAGGKLSWLKIHGWSHNPRAFFPFFPDWHFPIVVRNFCPQLSSQLPKILWTCFFSSQIIAFPLPLCLSALSNLKESNRMSFIPAKTSEPNNQRTLGLLCEKGLYNFSVSLQDGWLALQGAVKHLVPSFGASFSGRLLN